MVEFIGTFYGKPISTMSREELLEVVKWFAEEDKKKDKRIEDLENQNIQWMKDLIKVKKQK